MINSKYYNDIKQFPTQFSKGLELAQNVYVNGKFTKIVVCGMGGSSLYVDFINNIFQTNIQANRSYTLPQQTEDTLFIISSYSGNTEETISCLHEVKEKKLLYIILTSGGILLEDSGPKVILPKGIQPRLSTGYFIASVIKIMENHGLIKSQDNLLNSIQEEVVIDEEYAQKLASQLKNTVPIIYTTTVNESLARIIKIKFNENCKIQAFSNSFPELNHNEMVGFTHLMMNPYFLIFQSKFTHPRNKKRIEIFTDLMQEKNIPLQIIQPEGNSLLLEMVNTYHFMDCVTYYLAEELGIDPEPVAMVEDFKSLLL